MNHIDGGCSSSSSDCNSDPSDNTFKRTLSKTTTTTTTHHSASDDALIRLEIGCSASRCFDASIRSEIGCSVSHNTPIRSEIGCSTPCALLLEQYIENKNIGNIEKWIKLHLRDEIDSCSKIDLAVRNSVDENKNVSRSTLTNKIYQNKNYEKAMNWMDVDVKNTRNDSTMKKQEEEKHVCQFTERVQLEFKKTFSSFQGHLYMCDYKLRMKKLIVEHIHQLLAKMITCHQPIDQRLITLLHEKKLSFWSKELIEALFTNNDVWVLHAFISSHNETMVEYIIRRACLQETPVANLASHLTMISVCISNHYLKNCDDHTREMCKNKSCFFLDVIKDLVKQDVSSQRIEIIQLLMEQVEQMVQQKYDKQYEYEERNYLEWIMEKCVTDNKLEYLKLFTVYGQCLFYDYFVGNLNYSILLRTLKQKTDRKEILEHLLSFATKDQKIISKKTLSDACTRCGLPFPSNINNIRFATSRGADLFPLIRQHAIHRNPTVLDSLFKEFKSEIAVLWECDSGTRWQEEMKEILRMLLPLPDITEYKSILDGSYMDAALNEIANHNISVGFSFKWTHHDQALSNCVTKKEEMKRANDTIVCLFHNHPLRPTTLKTNWLHQTENRRSIIDSALWYQQYQIKKSFLTYSMFAVLEIGNTLAAKEVKENEEEEEKVSNPSDNDDYSFVRTVLERILYRELHVALMELTKTTFENTTAEQLRMFVNTVDRHMVLWREENF